MKIIYPLYAKKQAINLTRRIQKYMGFETKEVLLGCFVYSNFNDISAHPGQWKKLTKYKSVHLRIHITFSTAPEKWEYLFHYLSLLTQRLYIWKGEWFFSLTSGSHLPKKKFIISFNESPSKMMKNDFYFILKALYALKIFKFLSWLFGHVEKTASLEKKRLILKSMTSQPG